MSATGSIRYIGKKPSSAEVKERSYVVGTDFPAQTSPVSLTLPDNYATSYIEVLLNGVKLDPTDYSASDGSTITFIAGIELVDNDLLVIRSYDFATTPRVNPIIQIKETIGPTGTKPSGTTHFDVAFTSTLDEVLIYKDGILLTSDQFSVDTSLNSVDLTTIPADGSEINIVIYGATKVIGSSEAITQTYIDNQISTQTATLQTSIDEKALTTTVNTEVTRIDNDIAVLTANKVDQTYVDNAVASLADQTYVDSAIASVVFETNTVALDILPSNTGTTSLDSSLLDDNNVIWFQNDGNVCNSSGANPGKSQSRNIGELNNYFQVTKLGDLLYIDCKFTLMDLNELIYGTGFNTTELTEGKNEVDESIRWSSNITPSSGSSGLNLNLSEHHEMMPFHVEMVNSQKCIVPHVPYVSDNQTIHITGMPWGTSPAYPSVVNTDWNSNKFVRIHDWRLSPAIYQLNLHGTSAGGSPAFTLTKISGTTFDIDELSVDTNHIYFFRYYDSSWTSPSGYYVSATDNGYGPATSLSYAQRGSRISCPATLAKYKLCTLPAGYRPANDVEVPIKSSLRKKDFASGLLYIEGILDVMLNESTRLNKGATQVYNPYTHNADITTAINNGEWFGDWTTRKAETDVLFAMAYGYTNNSQTTGYTTGFVDPTLGGEGSFHPGLSGNWEYHTTSNTGTLGTNVQNVHLRDASSGYRYFLPHSYWAKDFENYGFDVKWYGLYPSDDDFVYGTKIQIKTNGDVLLYGKSGEEYFNLGIGPQFYKSKRTAFYGASFKTEISLV